MISASDPAAQGDELMDKIKPVAWANKCATDGNLYGIEYGPDGDDTRSYAVEFGDEAVPLYDQSAIDSLRDEAERLRVDASRYRFLRANASWGTIFCGPLPGGSLNCDEPESEWDAAIDAAMKDEAP